MLKVRLISHGRWALADYTQRAHGSGSVLLRFSSEVARTCRFRSLFHTSHEPMVRYAADFARALGAARSARNARTAQAATGDVVLRYSSQVRFKCSAVSAIFLGREAPWGVSVQQGAQQAYVTRVPGCSKPWIISSSFLAFSQVVAVCMLRVKRDS